jgi:hypothetical protein
MKDKLVDPRKKGPKSENLPTVGSGWPQLTVVQKHCALLLGQGKTVAEVAERMVDYMIQNTAGTRKERLKRARNRIRTWHRRADFRDIIWDVAVQTVDASSPAMLKGLRKKAEAGRVDAAKLLLEITERYSPKGELAAANVQVVFSNLPRPVDGEAEEVEDAEVEPSDDEV